MPTLLSIEHYQVQLKLLREVCIVVKGENLIIFIVRTYYLFSCDVCVLCLCVRYNCNYHAGMLAWCVCVLSKISFCVFLIEYIIYIYKIMSIISKGQFKRRVLENADFLVNIEEI